METLLETLNEEQRQAACYQGEADHIMLLAGAGTGKTRTIIARTLFLLEKGADPRRLLLMTFTRRAAKEMKERLELEIGEQAACITAGTFHHFCLNIMRARPELFGIENRSLVDRDDQVEIMRFARATHIKDAKVDKHQAKEIPKASALVNLYSYSRNTLSPVDEYLDHFTGYETEIKEQIKAVFGCYEERKKLRGYLDFDDILYIFASTLEQVELIRNYVKDLFDYILVDEMQDTNPVQWKILEQIHNPAKLFCVGDDAQSIYAFRGADFKNVHRFTKRIENSVILRLEENYRSTQEILELANWLLDKAAVKYDKKLHAFRGKGKYPVLKTLSSDQQEAAFVVSDIMARHRQGTPYRNIMIMVRSAFAARSLEAELIANSISYRFIGGMSLLQMAHIKDILALVRCAVNPQDELAWIRFLKLFPKVGDVTAVRMFQKIHDLDSIGGDKTALNNALNGRTDIYKLLLSVAGESKPAVLLDRATKSLDPVLGEIYSNWKQRKKDIKAVAEIAERYEDVTKFIEEYSLDPEYNEKFSDEDPEEKLTIITVHSAKGTEADICYIFQARAGMFPHSMCKGEPDGVEEERRVLYVAMTRAKNELIITRNYGFSSFYNQRDTGEYFLSRVPDALLGKRPVSANSRDPFRKATTAHQRDDEFDDEFGDEFDDEFDDDDFDAADNADGDVPVEKLSEFINKFGGEFDQKNREDFDDIPF